MNDIYENALSRGRRAGIVLAAALMYGCGAGTQPLRLPEGHPADPATPGMPHAAEPPAPVAPAAAPAIPSPATPAPTSGQPGNPAPPAPAPAPAPPAPQPAPTPPAPPAKTYTCPMHPEVVSNEPGRCPKCGMRLQEVKPAKGEDSK